MQQFYRVPQSLKTELIALIDIAAPECYYKRRFNQLWLARSIDFAFADLLTCPILDRNFIPRLEAAVEKIKSWDSN